MESPRNNILEHCENDCGIMKTIALMTDPAPGISKTTGIVKTTVGIWRLMRHQLPAPLYLSAYVKLKTQNLIQKTLPKNPIKLLMKMLKSPRAMYIPSYYHPDAQNLSPPNKCAAEISRDGTQHIHTRALFKGHMLQSLKETPSRVLCGTLEPYFSRICRV